MPQIISLSVQIILLTQFLSVSLVKAEQVAQESEVIILTEEDNPYSYLNQNGEVIGIATKKVRALFEQAEIPLEIKLVPWQRVIREYKNDPNILMYSVSRFQYREKNYQWIVPLHTATYKIYGLKGKFDPINTNISSGDYKFVCTENTISCEVINHFNVPKESVTMLSRVSPIQMIKMVNQGRVDFLVLTDEGIEQYINKLGLDRHMFEHLEKYYYLVDEYLAGNPDINKALLKKLQDAAKKLNLL